MDKTVTPKAQQPIPTAIASAQQVGQPAGLTTNSTD
jgi:hypothetical protein